MNEYVKEYVGVLKKYAEFNGRARRKEQGIFLLVSTCIMFVLLFVDSIIGTGMILTWLYSMAITLPSFALIVRRCHDIGWSGWWILLLWVPIVGIVFVFIILFKDSQFGENKYGPNPKESKATLAV